MSCTETPGFASRTPPLIVRATLRCHLMMTNPQRPVPGGPRGAKRTKASSVFDVKGREQNICPAASVTLSDELLSGIVPVRGWGFFCA